MKEKFILDACCGGRMIWFDKKHPNAIYIDIRREEKGFITDRPEFEVNPDMIADFRSLPFEDKKFKLVVWDPPHLIKLGHRSWMAKKYGVLNGYTWQEDLKKGFQECWRVLQDYGILVFKWSEEEGKSRSKPFNQLIKLFEKDPLFGHTTGSKSHTHWACFMKIPEEK